MRKVELVGCAALLTIAYSVSKAQIGGPKGTLVNYCLAVNSANGTYRFSNKCPFMVEVAAAQPYPNGQPNGSDTFELEPSDSHTAGTATLSMRFWACATPSVPISSSTKASPMSNSTDVICPTDGNAGAAY